MGDPLRTVVEAPTKLAAEETAARLGFSKPWAHPVTNEQARQVQAATEPPAEMKTGPRHPHLTMRTPSTAELRTAIEVLKMLDQRINDHAAHSITQLPDTELGDQYATHIEAQTIEQTSHIEKVSMQLNNWRDELLEQRRQSIHV